jgi:hypothetical protein
MDIFRLDPQTRTCKATGIRRVFEHLKTEAIAIFKPRCANCGGEHLVRIPVVHQSRMPMVPDKPTATICPECINNVVILRHKATGKHICRLPPRGHPAHPECGEDLE